MARPLAKPMLALATLVLLAALVTAVAASVSGAATASKRVKKCTNGRVLVKVNKKPSCKPLRSVLPKPKTGDRRLIALREALTVDVSKLKGRRGKRGRKLPPRAAAASRKARKISLRALPKLIAMLDNLGQPAGSAAQRRVRPHTSKAPCGGPGSAVPDSETGRTGGAGIQATQGANGEVGAVITAEVNGFTTVTSYTLCGVGGYYVNGCPKSNGDAPSSGTSSYDVTVRILEGKNLISSLTTSARNEDRMLGKVMKDAQLKYFDFTRKEETLTVATGGVVQGGSATRTVRVNMPSGSYDAAHSSVSITGDASSFKEDDLAASIDMAIKEYKAAQNGGSFLHTDGWATVDRKGKDPYCAKAVFSPASDTRKLPKGKSDRVSVYAKGNDGGKAADARWTVLDQTNAKFTPASPSGAEPSINYTVSTAPAGNQVRVTVKFTSTAGVGKDTWTQPIGDLPTINHIAGTFSGSYNVHGSIVSWTGNATFDRATPAVYGGASGSYNPSSGGYDLTASGLDGSGATACQQTGTKHLDLGPGSGGFDVDDPADGSHAPPYTYSVSAAALGPQNMEITRVQCPPGAEDWDGTTGTITYMPVPIDTRGSTQQTPDGIVYHGSSSDTQSGVTTTQSWAFDGTE